MRLILNRRTDYAFRALIALASAGSERRSARRIAREMAIPSSFVGPIMAELTRAGLVSGTTGRTGGYQLAVDASAIVLREVITALERDEAPTHCSLVDRMCHPTAQCAIHPIWAAASTAYLEIFGSVTLASMAATEEALREGGLS